MSQDDQDNESVARVLADTSDFTDVTIGVSEWQTLDGRYVLEEDYRVAGEVWRVHKNDPDPHPSLPHAHCVAGADRFVGCKLHLGTGQLYKGRNALNRKLSRKQFEQLIAQIQEKFPDAIFPLPA